MGFMSPARQPAKLKTRVVMGIGSDRDSIEDTLSEVADPAVVLRPIEPVSGSGSPTHFFCIEHNLDGK